MTPAPTTTASAPLAPAKGFQVALVRKAVAALGQLWTVWKRRREIGNLLEMDDWMLKDIGLSRGDVHDALADRLTHDPSSRLASTAARHLAAERSRARDSLRLDEAVARPVSARRLDRAA